MVFNYLEPVQCNVAKFNLSHEHHKSPDRFHRFCMSLELHKPHGMGKANETKTFVAMYADPRREPCLVVVVHIWLSCGDWTPVNHPLLFW